MRRLNNKRLEIFFEFLIFGIVVGIAEDIIAIKLATDAEINFETFVIVALVAIPFAVLGELIVDRVNWFQK